MDIYFDTISDIRFGIFSEKVDPIPSLSIQSGANAVNMRSVMISAVKVIGEKRNTKSLAAGIDSSNKIMPYESSMENTKASGMINQ